MKFTELLKEIRETYPEQPRAFHVMATRYYLGAESKESLQQILESDRPCLSHEQVEAIVRNR